MDCHEKEFGCLCKNVGGHFPCLFHGIYVKPYFMDIYSALPRPNPPLNSIGADPGPAAPALSPAPGALLYADLSESGLSPPNPPDDGGCDGRDLASVRDWRLRVAGTI